MWSSHLYTQNTQSQAESSQITPSMVHLKSNCLFFRIFQGHFQPVFNAAVRPAVTAADVFLDPSLFPVSSSSSTSPPPFHSARCHLPSSALSSNKEWNTKSSDPRLSSQSVWPPRTFLLAMYNVQCTALNKKKKSYCHELNEPEKKLHFKEHSFFTATVRLSFWAAKPEAIFICEWIKRAHSLGADTE